MSKSYTQREAKQLLRNEVLGWIHKSQKWPKKTSCDDCGIHKNRYKNNLLLHHDDYNNPFNVRYLCKKCHIKWHKENNAIELKPENFLKIYELYISRKRFPYYSRK